MQILNHAYVRTITAIQHRTEDQSDPDGGLTTVEWGLITGLVAAVAIGAVAVFGDKVANIMNGIPNGG